MIKKLFFLDDKLENRLKFWTLLGPFFLLITSFLSSTNLSYIILLGIFLCYRLKKIGFYLSSIFLVSYSLYNHLNIIDDHLIEFAIEFSAFLGFFISGFSLLEINNFFSHFEDQKLDEINLLKANLEKSKANLENHQLSMHESFERINCDLEKKDIEIKSLKEDKKTLEESLDEIVARKDFLLNEIESKEKQIDENNIKLDELYEKISFLKDEEFLKEENLKFQNEIESLKKENLNLVEKIDNLNNQTSTVESNATSLVEFQSKIELLTKENLELKDNLQKLIDIPVQEKDPNKEYHNLNSLYKQLKDQFEEKQRVLHKTRRDLFVAQEELSATLKEKNSDYVDLTSSEKQLISDLENAGAEIFYLLSENEKLKDIITLLNVKPKSSDKKEKSKNIEPKQDLLF